MTLMNLKELDTYFRSILQIAAFEKYDSSLNGIQIGQSSSVIQKVAFAVDACIESFRTAAQWGADVLCVHHGLFWGKPERIEGVLLKRIKFLLDHDLALYAAHLPLDADPALGNNIAIAHRLGLEGVSPFGIYNGVAIGIKGTLPHPDNLETIASTLFGPSNSGYQVLPFGKPLIETVAVVSGGAASEAFQAVEAGVDLFITGESSHTIYHTCLEAGLNVLFGGHYQTETGGVQGWAEKTAQDTGLETRFFDIPTGF